MDQSSFHFHEKKRVVVKIGSSSLNYEETGNLNFTKLEHLVRELCNLRNRGMDVCLVSSGAIAVGRQSLGMTERPRELSTKQACAAVGQARLMMIYQKLFAEYNQVAGQVLMTKNTMVNPVSRENAKNTFDELFRLGAIPIVNENDTVSTYEMQFGDNDEGFIDYDKVEEIAMECKPKMIIAGASAYARTIDFKRFREIADACGAVLMVDMAHIAGLVAAGLHPSPIPYAHVVTTTTHKTLRGPRGGMILSSQEIADKYNFNKAIFPGIQGGPLMHVIAAKAVCFKEALQPEFKVYQQNIIDNAQALCKGLLSRDIKIVSGGTDNHLMLVDLTNYDQTGKTVEKLLDSVNITCNKNTIPNDPKSPFVTSGVRLGTPAVTSRGLNTEDMDQIAEAIAMMIKEGEPAADKARAIVKSLTEKYPLER